jgi:hypothetical protein
MNLGRFHAAVFAVKIEINNDRTIELLNELIVSLEESIRLQTSESAKAFKTSYSKLSTILQGAKSNTDFPTRRQIYNTIGADKYIGKGLFLLIEKVISENQIAPATALLGINNILSEVIDFQSKMETLEEIFEHLEIEYDNLDEGQFEIGFSFPHKVIGTDLLSLEKEFHRIDFALKTLQEIATGEVSPLNIKTISASEWQVFMDSVPALAMCFSVAIERIVALYKNNLEIKLLKQQLDDKKLPEVVTQPLQEHIEKTVKEELRKVSDELVDKFYKRDDEARKNELKNQASQALLYLADRLDKGATVEVHTVPPEKPEETTENKDGEKIIDPKLVKQYKDQLELANKINNTPSLDFNSKSIPVLAINYQDESIPKK